MSGKDKQKTIDLKDLFHTPMQIEKVLTLSLIVTALFGITGAVTGEGLLAVIMITGIICYAKERIYFPVNKYPQHIKRKYDCSLENLITALRNAGLELNGMTKSVYIFKTQYFYFRNGQVLVIKQKDCCEVIALESVLECLNQYLVSKKI